MDMSTVTLITTLEQLKQQLLIPGDKWYESEMILGVLEQPTPFPSREVVSWATRAVQAAEKHNRTAELARALYLRGVAYLTLWREKVAAGGPDAGRSDREHAEADLNRSFKRFLEAEQEYREDRQRQAERQRRRDKAREQMKVVPDNAVIERLRCGSVQAALGQARLLEYGNAPGDALRWIRKAITRCDEMPLNAVAATAYEALGELLRNTGDIDAAIEELRRALTIRRQLSDTEGTAAVLARLAAVHHERGETDAALQYNRESHGLYERAARGYTMMGNKAKAAFCRYHMLGVRRNEAELLLALCEPVNALELAARVLEGYDMLSQEKQDPADLATVGDIHENVVNTYVIIGRAHEMLGQLEPALDQYAMAYTRAKQHGRPHLLLPILLHVGRAHRTRGEIIDALSAFRNALEIARATGNYRLQAQFHRQLSETLQSDRQFEQALEHYKRFAEIQEELAGSERQTAIAVQRVRFDTEQRELETRVLRERNALLEDELAYFVITVGLRDESAAAGQTEYSTRNSEQASPSTPSQKNSERESAYKWVYFQNLLDARYPGFLKTLRERASALTEKHLQVCSLMRLGLGNKDVAKALRIDLRTLQSHRNDIRKRLPGTPSSDLVTWMLNVTSPVSDPL